MSTGLMVRSTTSVLIFAVLVLMVSCPGANESVPLLDGSDYSVYLEASKVGTYGAYTYEFWNQNETGDTAMGLRADGSFEVIWQGIFNMLARNGVRPGQNVTDVTYTVEGYEASSASYLCVYGWFYDGNYEKLVEYYIVDNWKNYNPGKDNWQAVPEGVVTVDGATYKLYTSERVQQPSINGTATFTQYWSIRDELRTSGTINVPAHFQAWDIAGLDIGSTLHEVSFCVEGYGGNDGGSGYANVTELVFSTQ